MERALSAQRFRDRAPTHTRRVEPSGSSKSYSEFYTFIYIHFVLYFVLQGCHGLKIIELEEIGIMVKDARLDGAKEIKAILFWLFGQ